MLAFLPAFLIITPKVGKLIFTCTLGLPNSLSMVVR